MTESLHMAIERLLEALDNPAGDAAADSEAASRLRARLASDVSEALAHEGSEPTLSEDQLLNELAAHLDNRSSEEERRKVLAAFANEPEALATLQSAAAFLADLEPVTKPVAPDILAEAMAAFAPEPVMAAAAAAPAAVVSAAAASAAAPSSPERINWRVYGAMAATLLIAIGGGSEFWRLSHGPGTPPEVGQKATSESPQAPEAVAPPVSVPPIAAPPIVAPPVAAPPISVAPAPLSSHETAVPRLQSPAAAGRAPARFAKSPTDCVAEPEGAAHDAAEEASAVAKTSDSKHAEKPLESHKQRCKLPEAARPEAARPAAAPAAKPVPAEPPATGQAPLGSPY